MIRVLVVDDHTVVRRGLEQLLEREDDIEVVGSVGDGAEAIDAAAMVQPDVVLMDLSMPGLDGVSATRALLAERPETRVVVLTSFAEKQKILDSLEAGAIGYLLK